MDQALTRLGLNDKEIRVYSMILQNPAITASELAKATQEQRTNVYALLESLEEKGIIESTKDTSVKQFRALEPSALRRILEKRYQELKETEVALSEVLPRLKSQYALATSKPGVIHMAGMDGLIRLLDDMLYSKTEVLLIASDLAEVEVLRGFKDRLLERKSRGIKTRAIAHSFNHSERKDIFAERGMELRFLGEVPYTGEVVLYDDNVAFTVYKPSIVTTVITNQAINETMCRMFESMWEQSRP